MEERSSFLSKEERRRRIGTYTPEQIRLWRQMSPIDRLEIAMQAYLFALEAVQLTETARHPDLSAEALQWRGIRRMQGEPSLGRARVGSVTFQKLASINECRRSNAFMRTYKFETTIKENGMIQLPELAQFVDLDVELIVVVKTKLPQSQEMETPSIEQFLQKWRGFLKGVDPDEAKFQYLQNC